MDINFKATNMLFNYFELRHLNQPQFFMHVYIYIQQFITNNIIFLAGESASKKSEIY